MLNNLFYLSRKKLFITEKNQPVSHKKEQKAFQIREVSKDNLKDAEWFNTSEEINWFNNFLDSGYEGYYVYLENQCVHRTWIFNDSKRSYLGDVFIYEIGENLMVTWSLTHKDYRRRNIYKQVLLFLRSRYFPKQILGVVDFNNKNSISAFLKSGFIPYKYFILFRFYKIKIWIQYKKFEKINLKFGFGGKVR